MFKTQLFQRVVDKKNPERYSTTTVADTLAPPKDVPKQDFSDCLGYDSEVLDKIIDGLGDVVRNIEHHETFERPDNEVLTEQELKEADAEYQDEILRRNDPEAWNKKHDDLREAQRKRQKQQSEARAIAGNAIPRPSGPVNTPMTGPRNVPAMSRVLGDGNSLFASASNRDSKTGSSSTGVAQAMGPMIGQFSVRPTSTQKKPPTMGQFDGAADDPADDEVIDSGPKQAGKSSDTTPGARSDEKEADAQSPGSTDTAKTASEHESESDEKEKEPDCNPQ
jgi:hypothetical protein